VKGRERTLLIVGLSLILGTAGMLLYMKSHQRLGKPGVRAVAVPDSVRLHIELPTNAPGFTFKESPPNEMTTNGLPKDTSFRGAVYEDAEGIIQTMVVMMGTDRTSIHRPQFCLTGAGWNIDGARSEMTTVRIDKPRAVDLPVMKLIAQKTFEKDGKQVNASGVYVYWFVADKAVTADYKQRLWWMAEHLLRTGELQRWSYITYFAPCAPGQEDRAYRRIQRLMNSTLPEYQLAWPAPLVTTSAAR
jgi:hypothetical protein